MLDFKLPAAIDPEGFTAVQYLFLICWYCIWSPSNLFLL